MSTVIIIIATVSLMIFVNGLYVAAEFATVSSRRTRVGQMAGQGNRLARLLLPIMEDSKALDNYVAACQIGITISSLVVGAYGQNEIATRLHMPLENLLLWLQEAGLPVAATATDVAAVSIASILVLAGVTILQVIMGELFPKSVAIQYPEQVATWTVIPMRWSLVILRPFIFFFNGSGRLILKLMGRKPKEGHQARYSPQEIELLVTESHEGGLLEDSERQMLRNAFRLRDLTARQVMLHRTRLIAVPLDTPIEELLQKSIEAGFSRIPVYEESIDEIVGFVHIKDVFRLHVEQKTDLRSVVRDVVYVPETLPVADVWDKLNTRRKYLAIVFDEYGGTAGLITFEDLIEEIFGELQDEFDDEMALIARDKDGRIYLRGDLLVADVNEYLGLNLPAETADTLSGLIFHELGRPPHDQEELEIGDVVMRIEAMVELGVAEVSFQLPQAPMIDTFSEWEVADHE